MDRIGDDQAGFSVRRDPAEGRVEVTGWGFWTVDVATAFATTVLSILRERTYAKLVVLDMSDLKPMREEGQKSFASVLRAVRSFGVARTRVVTTSQLTKLQLVRIATEAGGDANIDWTHSTNALARGT